MKPASKVAGLSFAGLLLLCLAATSSATEGSGKTPLVTVSPYLSHGAVHPGDTFQIAVVAIIKKGFHINSNTPADTFLVPSVVAFQKAKGIQMTPPAYPVPELISLAFSPNKVSVYEGRISITATGHVDKDIEPGHIPVKGTLSYQACDDHSCFRPESVSFEVSLSVVTPDKPVMRINQDIFQGEDLSVFEEEAKRTIESGLIHALWVFFLFGLSLNLTPCVYPVIPMTVGFFGNQGEQKKGWTIILAILYVLGIAVVFSALGIVSGLAGKQWGFLFQSPWFVITIAVAILAMAASMFGAFEIRVPSFLMQLGGKSRQGALGALIMGATVGVVIAPCAAGIVLGLVGVIAKLGMVWQGGLFFFVLGLGLGFPYLFLAVSSSFMTRLPQSGMWMVWVRKLFGILLVGVALYFLIPQGKQATDQHLFYLGVLGIFGGLFLGFLDKGEGYKRTFQWIRATIGCVIIIAGIVSVQSALQPATAGLSWSASIDAPLAQKKPVVIDFYADWCAACKELDRRTFSDKKVIAMARGMAMVKVDLTTPTAANAELQKRFDVTGLPTVVFLDSNGIERKDLRVVGFVGPDAMLEKMKAIQKKNSQGKNSRDW